jgi:hypothetical protein
MRYALRIPLGAILALSACAVDGEPPELDVLPIITYNSLAPATLLNNGDPLNTLAGGALNGATTSLVNSPEGQSLLSYVVKCALASGVSASFPVSGGPNQVYTGLLGYAPAWRTGSLNLTGRRLVTGCLMAHVNAFETKVPISVRTAATGEPPVLERTLFLHQEMVAYGNIFAAAADREMYVCFGRAVATSLGGDGGLGALLPSYLDLRICSTSQNCGFNRVGACYRWPLIPSVTEAACEVESGSFYDNCHEAPIEQGPTPAWDETVSVYIETASLTLLLAEYVALICDLTGGLVCEIL